VEDIEGAISSAIKGLCGQHTNVRISALVDTTEEADRGKTVKIEKVEITLTVWQKTGEVHAI